MSTLAGPIVYPSHAMEILEVAHALLGRRRREDLVQKVTVVQGYLELTQAYPDVKYDQRLRNALKDLTTAVHSHLRVECHGSTVRSSAPAF